MRTMKKICKVVMLPTENEAINFEIFINESKNNKLDRIRCDSFTKSKCQHLYIASDDVMKGGDWIFRIDTKEVFKTGKVSDIFVGQKNTGGVAKHLCRKVIASTNKSLGLPGIPESFIKKYVEENGKISEVMVEFEEQLVQYANETNNSFHGKDIIEVLKTREDNTIRILPAKMYSREEVNTLLYKFNKLMSDDQQYENTTIDKWIENNLK